MSIITCYKECVVCRKPFITLRDAKRDTCRPCVAEGAPRTWLDETESFVKKRGTVEYEIASRFLEDAGRVSEQLGDEYRLMVGDSQALRDYLDAIAAWHKSVKGT